MTYANETSADRPRYHVQEQLSDGLWYGLKLFAKLDNAKHFASTVSGTVRIMPLLR